MSDQRLSQAPQKKVFSVAINTPAWQKMISDTLGDENRKKRFVSAITSAVSANPQLQSCDPGSILSAAFLGESLNLSPSPQLGQYYMVPYSGKAQFQIGYKGLMQLAMRSGQITKLNAVAIKEGEFRSYDPLNEEINVMMIDDWDAREAAPTVGYYAFFEMANGFRKPIYMSKKQMEAHARRYSKSYSSFWGKSPEMFDAMAIKTILRQLITKGGCPMSTEMIAAIDNDGATGMVDVNTGQNIIDPVAEPEYDDAPQEPQSIQSAQTGGGEEMRLDDFG